MKTIRNLIVCIGFLSINIALAQTEPTKKQVVYDYPEIIDHYEADMQDKFKNKQWAELEKEATADKTTLDRFDTGNFKLDIFYKSFCSLGEQGSDTLQKNMLLFQGWEKAYPNSYTPILAWANALNCYGWHARGNKYEIPEGQAEIFINSEIKVLEILKQIQDAKNTDPQWYVLYFTEIQAVDVTTNRNDNLFASTKEAYQKYPTYYPIYRMGLHMQQPKWGGSPDLKDIGKYIGLFNFDLTKNDDDVVLYTEMFYALAECYCQDTTDLLQYSGAKWRTIEKGWHIIEQRYPSVLSYVKEGKMAALANDMEDFYNIITIVPSPSKAVTSYVFGGDGHYWDENVDYAQKYKQSHPTEETPEQKANLQKSMEKFKAQKEEESYWQKFLDWMGK